MILMIIMVMSPLIMIDYDTDNKNYDYVYGNDINQDDDTVYCNNIDNYGNAEISPIFSHVFSTIKKIYVIGI